MSRLRLNYEKFKTQEAIKLSIVDYLAFLMAFYKKAA